jgi:hypothetical protein
MSVAGQPQDAVPLAAYGAREAAAAASVGVQ